VVEEDGAGATGVTKREEREEAEREGEREKRGSGMRWRIVSMLHLEVAILPQHPKVAREFIVVIPHDR
jgi:hypothetical protein